MSQNSDPTVGRANAQRGLPTHCRRVRAVAVELARLFGTSIQEQRLLADAALVHHYPPELLNGETIGSTLAIMQRQCRFEPQQLDAGARRRHHDHLLKVLKSFHSISLNYRKDALPGLLAVANYWVGLLESPGVAVDARESALDTLRRKTGEGLIAAAAYRALANFPMPRKDDLARSVSNLPVYPALALRVLALAADDTVSFGDLSALVSKDQVLTGRVIDAANSCLFSPVMPISTIGHAISHIGLEETRRIITAAALRPLFASSGLAELWKHSLEVSRWSEEVAARVPGIRKDEAFLAGLVHDAGRLLALKHSGEASLAFARLLEQGCDPVFAETCVFGCDHADLGAGVLEVWNFPGHLVNAVRYHHRPEQSTAALSSLLYLAESRGPAESGEPSTDGMEYALAATGLATEVLESVQPDLGLLRSLSFGT